MDKGFRFGRRKSDWLIPGALLLILGAAVGWGLYNRTRNHDERVMGKLRKTQVQLMTRILSHQRRADDRLAGARQPSAMASPRP